MSIIRATEEGLEIDGVLLKDTTDLKAYIGAHAPSSIEVSFGINQPVDLEVYLYPGVLRPLYINIGAVPSQELSVHLKLNYPKELQVELDINQPEALTVNLTTSLPQRLNVHLGINAPHPLPVQIGGHYPRDLYALLHGWAESDLIAYIDSHSPQDLTIDIGASVPHRLIALINSHVPKDLWLALYAIPPKDLQVIIRGFQIKGLDVLLGCNNPEDLMVYTGVSPPATLLAYLNPMLFKDLIIMMVVQKRGYLDLVVWATPVKAASNNLYLTMHIWGLKDLSVAISGHSFEQLTAHLWVWTPSDINVLVGITSLAELPTMEVVLLPAPEAGSDLIVTHGFYAFTTLNVVFGIWTEFYNLRINLWGVYKSDLNVVFSMGGYLPLTIDLPGTSGYRDLYVTCRPASRVLTTIIPVYTIEVKDLYVSINQGWPCGFGSSYKLLYIYLDASYKHDLNVYFKPIHGSGTDVLGVFVNRLYFDTYINTYKIKLYIPSEYGLPDTRIFDSTQVSYDNEFSDVVQDIFQLHFGWPRVKLLSGTHTLSVELIAYRGDKVHNLIVYLNANRQTPVRQPTSRPIIPKQGQAAPVWPEVFQVHEIELWGDDPPEVVRIVQIKFEEQIHEYYWISSEQKAIAKAVYERWAFLTRGYLPNAEYSGQIDYLTMRSLASMKRYDTIDQAVKAMISNFLYSGKIDLSVAVTPHGGATALSVNFTIRDWSRLKNLRVQLQPMHAHDLSVTINPI